MDNLQFPPAFFILLTAGLLTGWLAWFVARRQFSALGARSLFFLLLGCTYWSLVYAVQNVLTQSPWKEWVDVAVNPGIMLVPAAWLVFSLEYSGRRRYITRRLLGLLAIEPLTALALIFTNRFHYLYYASPTRSWVEAGGYLYLDFDPGSFFWLHTLYSYALIAIGSVLLLLSAWSLRGLYRKQAFILLAAVLIPWFSNVFFVASPLFGLTLHVDLTPIFFSLSGLLLVFGVFRFRLLDLTPLARDLLFEVLEDALIVVDDENRVVDLNPAACRLFDVEAREVIGKPARQLFQPVLAIAQRYANTPEIHEVITLPLGSETRYFDLRISPLKSKQRGYAGRMVLLRDMTTIYRAQQALQDSEARYRQLIESSPEVIFVLDGQGRMLLANPIALEKFALPGEVVEDRLGICHLFIEEDRDAVLQHLLLALETRQPQMLEASGLAWDGHPFAVEIHFSPLKSTGPVSEEVLCLVRDISERKRAEQKLLEAAETERRNRELAEALREIGMALSASLDVDEVLDKILESIALVIPYDSGNITLLEGRRAVITRNRGYERFGEHVLRAVRQFVFDIEHTENFRWMLENRRSLIIQDTHAYPGWVRVEATEYIHSWVGAPIIVQNEVLGFLSLDKCEEGFYRPEHARTLELFAAQAGQALYNARLYRQSRQMLEHEQKINQILERITSSIDLESTMQQITYYGCQLLGADSGLVALLDERRDVLVTLSVYDPSQKLIRVDESPRGTGLSWQAVERRRMLISDNYSTEPLSRPEMRNKGVYAFLAVPILTETETLGVLNYFMLSPEKKFDPKVIGLAETLARYSAVAIQKARLLEEATRRAREAETLQQASAAVSSALRLDQVLDQVLENLERVVPYDSCALFLKEGEELRVVAARGFPHPERVKGQRFPARDDLLLESHKTQSPIILADAQKDARFKRWGDAAHVRSWMGVPLIKRNTAIGFLTIDHSQPNVYTENHAKLALAFANQAAAAIENARLFESVQRMAVSDPLTGLYNRRHFFDLAGKEFYRARRYGKALAVVMMDLDDLKKINDSYGHLTGDQLIIFVAEQCRQQLRKADLAARFGGDEFILLLPETGLDAAMQVAWRLRDAVKKGFTDENGGVVVSGVSLGVSAIDADCNSLELLVNRADQALYTAKQQGKNRVCAWVDGQVRSFATKPLVPPKDLAV
uniref:Diguanylate cyclase n=1 Tax=Bellilinea caldifistulae TaxID=360411 RepID=A0A7C4L353_9CHLR